MDTSHLLCGRHGRSYQTDGMEGFGRFFAGSARDEALRFEATTHHYYQETARSVFAGLERAPLILILLREPSERIRSSFRYTRENLGAIDRRLSFDTYVRWLLDDEVERARPFYRSQTNFHVAARELEMSRYVEWIDLWKRDVGSEHLEIVLLDDLRDRPGQVCMRICQRLGIDSSFYGGHEFPVYNQSLHRVRSQALQRWLQRVSIPLPGTWKAGLRRIYRTLQEESGRNALRSETSWGVHRLREYFAPWNARLAERYDLDLTSW